MARRRPDDPTWQRAFGSLKPKKITERLVHKRVVKFLKEEYPFVRYYTTLDGEYHDPLQAQTIKALRHSRGVPDLIVFARKGVFSGLAIEIKKDREAIYTSKGQLRRTEHITEQLGWLEYMRDEGWVAEFGCGENECIELINKYLSI